MSTTTKTRPEWYNLLEKSVQENPKYTSYAFSTLSAEKLPKVRFVIHRGVTPNGLLLTTTDTRMSKPQHLSLDPNIEIAWWIDPTAEQFRITGKAYHMPSEATTVTSSINAMGLTGEGLEEGEVQYWEDKRRELWEKAMSGHLRGSFGRPTPGKKLSEIDSTPEDWPTRFDAKSDDPEEQKRIDEAYAHFAIIAIQPTAAEYLELKPTPNKRTQWKKEVDGSWGDKIECAP